MSDHEVERLLIYYNLTPAQTYQEREFSRLQLEAKETQLKIAITALEFYAKKGNWGYSEKPKNSRHKAWIIEGHDCGWCLENEKFVGGKRARQALEQIKNDKQEFQFKADGKTLEQE